MNRSELAQEIVRVSYLKGEFRLRSGQVSNHYFDKYQFESNPLLLKQLVKEMVKRIPSGTEIIAGLELGGVPLATAISRLSWTASCLCSEEKKRVWDTEDSRRGQY